MNDQKYSYAVIEDNGGGLHLFLFEPAADLPAKGFTGFEYNPPGTLVLCLDALEEGDDAHTWDGEMDRPLDVWHDLHRVMPGYQVICVGEAGMRTLFREKMGAAGHREFGDDEEAQP